ncbi:MAG: NTP transferase domain-containing protein [Candidatus Nealsonbacteria bacterium]|nr:NTP transferase domain-containing protein [Candidatus Nealsonbacteria bacterium]
MELTDSTTTLILAGGAGERLRPLTEHRAKPAVSFGGKYRIIDFVLSNCLHSRLRRIFALPQYEPVSLEGHLNSWSRIFSTEMGEYLQILSPRSQADHALEPYDGTADAVLQNIKYLIRERPEYVLILAGDQIYKMDYRELIAFHHERKADLTIAAAQVDSESAKRSGVIEAGEKQKVVGFEEKPENPKSSLVSMSVYVFSFKMLIEELEADAKDPRSKHDFGKNIIPKMLGKRRGIFVFPLIDKETQKPGYWRDLGTTESYHEASMDLCSVKPEFNLYDENWFWRTTIRQLPPAKTVFRSEVKESIICEGCVIDDAGIYRSILSPEVTVGRGVSISNSIIMRGVKIGDGARINKAIIDKENVIPAGSIIEAGAMRYDGEYTVTPSGIVAIGRKEDSLDSD